MGKHRKKPSIMKYSILILSIFIGFCFAMPAQDPQTEVPPPPMETEEIVGGWVPPQTAETEAPDYMEGEEFDGGMMPGGIAPADPSQGLADAEFIHKDLHSKNYLSSVCNYKIDEVLNYSTQVVAGSLTRIEYRITGSGCKDLVCKAQIWEKSWMDFKEVQNYKCE